MAYKSINPANFKEIKSYDRLTDEALKEKINKAHVAYVSWRHTSFHERSVLMRKLAALLQEKSTHYARIMVEEMGKPIKQARAEVDKCALVCKYYADNAEKFLSRQEVESNASKSMIQYDPLGVIYAVMPWNFPYWQVFRFAAPALMAGNTALLKHAENVPQCAGALEEMFTAAGFPEGVFQNLYISHEQSDTVIANKYVQGVTLTGSNRAGSHIAAKAGEHIKKHVLELGGSDAFIVLADADIEKAIATGVNARTMNAGQSCIAAKRFILHKDIADKFLDGFKRKMEALKIGDPMDESTEIGPMARKDLMEELEKQVNESVRKGAKVLLGGKPADREGAYYLPSILTDIPEDSPAYEDELFGPVAIVFVVADDDEAIRIANDHKYGLGGSLWTRDIEKALKMSHRLNSGSVFINDMTKSDPRLPFGGIKESGYGRELSHVGIHEFVNIKTVYVA
ncbi:MAG: NAD-dependent succinate-semialdehyde dehydrogenase [Bacteroidia bacterium]